jgi:hypothetical protein
MFMICTAAGRLRKERNQESLYRQSSIDFRCYLEMARFEPRHKSQQMRWTRRGADLLLQVRCAVYNGTFGSEFGQRFMPANDTHPGFAAAA